MADVSDHDRIVSLEARLDDVAAEVERQRAFRHDHASRLEIQGAQVSRLDAKVDALHARIDSIARQIEAFSGECSVIGTRLGRLETRLLAHGAILFLGVEVLVEAANRLMGR